MPPSTSQAILLVDGYNVVGSWHSLKQIRDRYGLEEARRELVANLAGYSAYQNFETHLVFDAQYQDAPSSREMASGNVWICYTDYRQTADTYIERSCALFRKDIRKFDHRLIVATSDRAQQLTVVGYGAEWISAEQLKIEVDLVNLRVRNQKQTFKKGRSPKRFLSHTIDPVARQRLAKLLLGQDFKE
ncbi:MAG: NYN domain-containing protein [Leptolyngbyaceae cyanobacterium CRU_2_3]|nr:NYN domain-containing protein [Leptolyngbyaceae cyanobacterium CRU_2_3]